MTRSPESPRGKDELQAVGEDHSSDDSTNLLTDSHSTASSTETEAIPAKPELDMDDDHHHDDDRDHDDSSDDFSLQKAFPTKQGKMRAGSSKSRKQQQQQHTSLSFVRLVRSVRPWMSPAIGVAYLTYRCSSWSRSQSLLQEAIGFLLYFREWLELQTNTSWQLPSLLLQDAMALTALAGLTRLVYILYHYTWQHDYKPKLVTAAFESAQRYVPAVQVKVDAQTGEMMEKGDEMLKKSPTRTRTFRLPWAGRSNDVVLQELQGHAAQEDENWNSGKVSGTVYHYQSKQHSDLMNQVFASYTWCNPLHPGIWPKVGQCEGEVISMTAHMMHAPTLSMTQQNKSQPAEVGIGCITSGGTESILLAIRAHLHYYGTQRGIQYPELICGSTAHAAVDKACDVYNIRKVVVDCNRAGYQLDPHEVRSKITSNTIMIYSSAPCYPQGVVDPISELSRVALEYDIGLHVDACLGGFVMAFLENQQRQHQLNEKDSEDFQVPVFDFRNPGVTSMSADTHKYGYASKGTSVVLYRHTELRHGQYFCYPHWSGGMYTTPTFAGSRAGALSACAWAAMVSIGEEGYRERARVIVRAARQLAKGVAAIPELHVLTDQPFVVVCFGAAELEKDDQKQQKQASLDIYRVQDMMKERGWALNAMQNPASVHMCVTLNVAPKIGEFLQDLKVAVKQAVQEGTLGRIKGTAGIYGTVGSVPAGAVIPTLRAFTDLTLAP